MKPQERELKQIIKLIAQDFPGATCYNVTNGEVQILNRKKKLIGLITESELTDYWNGKPLKYNTATVLKKVRGKQIWIQVGASVFCPVTFEALELLLYCSALKVNKLEITIDRSRRTGDVIDRYIHISFINRV